MPPSSPTSEAVKRARKSSGLSQPQAADLVHLGAGVRWSEYERGTRQIDPARWELFLIKTDQHSLYGPKKKPSLAVKGSTGASGKPGAE